MSSSIRRTLFEEEHFLPKITETRRINAENSELTPTRNRSRVHVKRNNSPMIASSKTPFNDITNHTISPKTPNQSTKKSTNNNKHHEARSEDSWKHLNSSKNEENSDQRRVHSAGRVRCDRPSLDPRFESRPTSKKNILSSKSSHNGRPSFGRTILFSSLNAKSQDDLVISTRLQPKEPQRPRTANKPSPHCSPVSPQWPKAASFLSQQHGEHSEDPLLSPVSDLKALCLEDDLVCESNLVEGDILFEKTTRNGLSIIKDTTQSDEKEEFNGVIQNAIDKPPFSLSSDLNTEVGDDIQSSDEGSERDVSSSCESLINSPVPRPCKDRPSFVPTLECLRETSELVLSNKHGPSKTSHIRKASRSKSPHRKASQLRRSDTYGAWMQKQYGHISNTFTPFFEALENRNFTELESLLDTLFDSGDHFTCDNTNSLLDTPRDDYSNTLFMAACHTGSKRGIRWCLSHGANVDCQNMYGNTGLHFAVEFGLAKISIYLRERQNASTEIKNDLGLTCNERSSEVHRDA